VPRAYEGMEEETIKIKKLKVGKLIQNSNLKNIYFFKNQNYSISLPVKC
jgi:hypothetical protein